MWWWLLSIYGVGCGMAFCCFGMFAWMAHSLTFGRSSTGDVLLTLLMVSVASILWLPILLFILVSYLWDTCWGKS